MSKSNVRKAIRDIVKGPKVVSTHPAIERERERKRNTSVSGRVSKDKVGITVRIKW